MWPMLLDMSRDECRRILRRLELEAYASIITAFRAQGALTKEKKNLLKDIASELNISMERHRAEVRRAVNDEKLATIAEHMAGPDTGTEWAIVGRRLVPLMPRLVPQTAFTVLANNVANLTAAGNARLPVPAATAKLPGSGPESSAWEPTLAEGSRVPNCPTAQSNQSQSIADQPLGSSNTPTDNLSILSEVHIKREHEEDGEEEFKDKITTKRMRTTSLCESESTCSSSLMTSFSQSRPVSTIASTLASSKLLGTNISTSTHSHSAAVTSSSITSTASRVVTVSAPPVPVKITLSSTSTWSTSTTSSSSSGATQKVIIVSSSGPCGSPSILQRSLSVPMVKTVSSTQSSTSTSSNISSSGSSSMSSALSRGPTSYIINSNGGQVSSQSGTVVTISTGPSSENSGSATSRNNSDGNMTATTVSIDGVPTAAYISSGASGSSNSGVSILGSGSSGISTSSGNMVHKIRPKPQSVSIGGISRPRTGPIVIPVTPNTHHPLHQSLTCGGTSGITVQQQKPKSLLGVHTVKQEVSSCTVSALGKTQGGMKILPISGVASGGSSMAKILPKPSKGSSLYVVNANSSTATSTAQMSVVSRVVPTSVLSPSPNLNLPTSTVSVLGTRTISTGTGSRINLSATAVARTVNSSMLPISSSSTTTQHSSNTTSGGTAVLVHPIGRTAPTTTSTSNVPVSSVSTISASSAPSSSLTSSSGKSNVIVVQKGPSGNTTFCRGVSLGTTTKEFVGKVLKGKSINSSMTAITVQRRPVSSTNSTVSLCNNIPSSKNGTGLNLPTSNSQGNVIVLDLSNEQIGSNSILNELLQGSGIYTESAGISSNGANANATNEESGSVSESRLSPSVSEAVEDVQNNQAVEPSMPSVLNVSQTRVFTLEEAVELFGASVGEDGQLLLGKKASVIEVPKQVASISSTSSKSVDSGGLGTVPPAEAEAAHKEVEITKDAIETENSVFVSENNKDSSSTNQLEGKPMDIFSTAIASAEINLDSIQYLDEDMEGEVGDFAVTIEPAPFDAAEIQMEEDTIS